MLDVGLSYMAFIMLKYLPLYPFSGEFLSWTDVEFCQKLILHLSRWSYDFFFFLYFVNMVSHIDWFVNLDQPSLHP